MFRYSRLCLVLLAGVMVLSWAAPTRADDQSAAKKKIVFVAGKPSHGFGAHEHKAGCLLLAGALNECGLNVEAIVVTGGWPKDEAVFDGADAVVMYCDGGGGHMVNPHLDQVDALAKKGVGIACLHYAVEVPKGKSGDAFLDWTGGYFETYWSVNPHWTASFEKFPDHPICRGVKPFSINDEWYYHMRFRPEMTRVTPILTAVPPESTRKPGESSHGGNEHVRARAGMPEHVAWAAERPDRGRGFGFTGGHVHWNWGNDSFRKVVLNAIAWTARVEIPEGGVVSRTPSVDDLLANQDFPPPQNFDRGKIQAMIDGWNKPAAE